MFYLLTYLIGPNNPINGFRPDSTHSSRRLCLLRVYASWSHKSMTALPRFGPSNRYKIVLFAGFHRMSLRSSYSSLLDRMRKSLPILTGPKILGRIFISNTLKVAAPVINRTIPLCHKEPRLG